jgi:hypothetical protein
MGAPELAVPVVVLGAGLMIVCFWRIETSLAVSAPQSTKLLLQLYLIYLTATVFVGLIMWRRAPTYEVEMEMFVQVRDFFLKENGMKWTKGLELPDGLYKKD